MVKSMIDPGVGVFLWELSPFPPPFIFSQHHSVVSIPLLSFFLFLFFTLAAFSLPQSLQQEVCFSIIYRRIQATDKSWSLSAFHLNLEQLGLKYCRGFELSVSFTHNSLICIFLQKKNRRSTGHRNNFFLADKHFYGSTTTHFSTID